MTEGASGRELKCRYLKWTDFPFWPSNLYCEVIKINFSTNFEKVEHSFSGSASEKSAVETFKISISPKLDFIPLEILTEFPNLSGIVIRFCKLKTVKAGLFRAELNRIDYLWLVRYVILVIDK